MASPRTYVYGERPTLRIISSPVKLLKSTLNHVRPVELGETLRGRRQAEGARRGQRATTARRAAIPDLRGNVSRLRRQCLSGDRRAERRAASRDREDLRRHKQCGVVSGIRRKGRATRRLPESASPHELDAIIRKEIERWTAIAKAANITVD